MKKNIFLELLLIFMKIGLFTFGGGYAMIAMIEHSCVEKKKWITHDEMMNIIVIGESTPGPIAINCATVVGYRQAGLVGAFVATLSLVLPSFVVMYAISRCFDKFLEMSLVAHIFNGIKIAVGFLILDAAITMIKKMRKSTLSWTIMLCSFAVMLFIDIFSWSFSPILVMLIAAAVSLAVFVAGTTPRRKDDATQ